MFEFDALCPHCEKKFKLSMIGLETKEFIQCPHCRRIIKLDLADPEESSIWTTSERSGTDASGLARKTGSKKPSA